MAPTRHLLPDTLAAVDLGSNSFHMIVAREVAGQPVVVDRLRERVGLAEGLLPGGELDPEVQRRAMGCLERFQQLLTQVPPDRVRAVGTATFRKAKRAHEFHAEAERVLGVPIEILPGFEEARLIYLGVAHSMGDNSRRRLVIDIGGASTEAILGQRFEAQRMESLSMGCVTFSRKHFPGGVLSPRAFDRAVLHARRELEPVEAALRDGSWEECVGASGTIHAVATILEQQGWCVSGISKKGLARLARVLRKTANAADLELLGMKEERRFVLAGGVAVLSALFEGLGIEHMQPSPGALREGLLYDLLGRIHHEDVRSSSVEAFAARMAVDESLARRMQNSVRSLFEQVAADWSLSEEAGDLLAWAAHLHAIGLAVSYSSYHRHGSYLIENADLPGFSQDERSRLAALVRLHRKRLRLEREPLPGVAWDQDLVHSVALLRVAVAMHRGRGLAQPPHPSARVLDGGAGLGLAFPDGWLAEHPLTEADLAAEALALSGIGIRLEFA